MARAAGDKPFQPTGQGVLIFVRLTPKSSADKIDGLWQGPDGVRIQAKVRAVPEDGKANTALCKVIAKWLDMRPSRVSLHEGAQSRLKQVLAEGEPQGLMQKLTERLAGLK
jgi:uncharacterized protein (TIGR00251 family)